MSQENVELARRLYFDEPIELVSVFSDPALLDAMRSQFEPLFQPDFVTVGDPSLVGSRPTATGMEGLLTFWRDWLSNWESWVVRPAEFIDVDEQRVLVLLDVKARSKTDRVDLPLPSANLLTIREGKVDRLELFTTQAEGRKAAGLSE